MTHRSQRGAALLFTFIVLLVITAIGVAMIRFATQELSSSTASRKQAELVSCAEAGRKVLLSKFKILGTPVTSVDALNVALDGRTSLLGGHYDAAPANPISVVQVSQLPAWAAGPTRPSTGNWRISLSGLGGKPYKVVVHCQVGGDAGDPTSGRQLEVEFGIRFGL